MSRPRAVVDTNVLVSSLVSPAGAPARVLECWRKQKFVLCASSAVLAEYHDTFVRKFKTDAAARKSMSLLAEVELKSARIPDTPELSGCVPGDPDDEKFVECAVAAKAVIVSGDKHLLNCDGYMGVAVVKPADFLRELNL